MGAQWRVINENYKNLEGYKRVAWPPASEERIVREFTPQPQQSPAPGSGGYYPQASAVAAPPQGPIYNNVQPRTQQPPQTQPQQQPPQPQQQHYQQQQAAQNVYGPCTNYASNGYAPAATVAAAPAATATQVPANNYNYPQQPIQYTQAQFNRQPSREPAPAPSPAPAPAPSTGSYAQYPQQQQQHYQPTYQQQQQQQPQQQQPIHAVDNVGGGWKHIGAPLPKTHNDFTAGGVAPAAAAYPSYQQQQHQQQQHQQYPHQVPFG